MKTSNGNIELLEIELTKRQMAALSKVLPSGFSLEQKTNRKKSITSAPSKKIFTNDGTQIVKKTNKAKSSPREEMIINKHVLRDPGKRKLSTHFEYKYPDHQATSTPVSKSGVPKNADAMNKCYNLLQKLKKHHSSAPFLYPVDVHGLGLVDYYDVVREPMDLSTVEAKLRNGQYLAVNAFAADVRKVWNNAFLYNMEGSTIYLMTAEMSAYFERNVREIETVNPSSDTVRDLEKKVELLSKQITELHQRGLQQTPENPKQNRSGIKSSKTAKLSEKPLTMQEKKTLMLNIKNLSPDHLRGVWDIVSSSVNAGRNGQEELAFDIDSLPVRVARELERYVKNKMGLINRVRAKNKAKETTPTLAPAQANYANIKQHEAAFEHDFRLEDEVTTQHHSAGESEGKADSKENLNHKGNVSPSNSSESSFISDSDSDGGEDTENKTPNKSSKSLQTQQELANFLAGGHGSMLNSFIVK